MAKHGIQALCLLILSFIFLLVSCKQPSPEKLRRTILENFLNFSGEEVDKEDIQYILYDIQSPTDTMGRAFKISDTLFLTNYHVIQKVIAGKYAQLIKQEKRGVILDREGEFEILEYDTKSDLALLQLRNYKAVDYEAVICLYDRNPKEKEKISEFIHLSGEESKHKGYHLDFGGKDIYSKGKYIKHLGAFHLPPNSALFEKKGYVLPFKEKKIRELTKPLSSKKEYEIVSSVPVYQGESGSPVFLETNENKYYLAGIVTKTLNTGEIISTPEDPLGYMAYHRTVSFIVHRNAIYQFIKKYLSKKK